ncbi:hypothetical protein GOODEAATRI_032771, partial [Goodea atripinnis]
VRTAPRGPGKLLLVYISTEISFKSGNKEGGEVCHSASIEKYNAIFSKLTSDELDGIVLTQSDYDLTRGVFLNVGELSVCNRLPPEKSKLRRKLVFKKDNPIPTENIHGREGDPIHAPLSVIVISPNRAPEKLTAPEEENLSNDLIQNPSLDNISQNCTSSVQEELKPPRTVKIPRVWKYLTLRKRQRHSALYTRAKLVRGLMN